MMWDWGHMGAGGTQVLFWVLLFALVAAGTVLAVLVIGRDRHTGDHSRLDERRPLTSSPAEDELEMRYARSEIDAEELARGRAALRQR